ncbi:kinase-like domain-containing protein [Diplogelasinospora grovesii]|uniref:Kinase-like domain-containing protein n=1 Tax=Diplogelasinospora grovesii TaxID=303347 RepID=A0AAN6S1P1_9PEZI|nr:kinase-like domain-containing protein [Diplogelasinospora grovesii]
MTPLRCFNLISRFQPHTIAAHFPRALSSTASTSRGKTRVYTPGGYHPLKISDRLHGRYRIVHKLGYGASSTTWLARDEKSSKYLYVAIKRKSWPGGLDPTGARSFWDRGPNGTHSCLVTAPERCSLADVGEASWSALFQLDVARSLAAQLAAAVAYVHDQGYAHGDLHLGNLLLRLPSELDHLSIDQLYDEFGPPEAEPIVRQDGTPLPPGVPSHAISPVEFGKPSEQIELSEAKLLLTDFGVAFCPSREARYESHTPLKIRPPEARFEPTKPVSFASDIWSLGCSIWAILGQRPVFDPSASMPFGRLPPEWWDKWAARSRQFTETGQPVDGRSPRSWDERFQDSMHQSRCRENMATVDEKERDALSMMIRWMLAFRSGDRPSAKQVLETVWMRDWALPAYEKTTRE